MLVDDEEGGMARISGNEPFVPIGVHVSFKPFAPANLFEAGLVNAINTENVNAAFFIGDEKLGTIE